MPKQILEIREAQSQNTCESEINTWNTCHSCIPLKQWFITLLKIIIIYYLFVYQYTLIYIIYHIYSHTYLVVNNTYLIHHRFLNNWYCINNPLENRHIYLIVTIISIGPKHIHINYKHAWTKHDMRKYSERICICICINYIAQIIPQSLRQQVSL